MQVSKLTSLVDSKCSKPIRCKMVQFCHCGNTSIYWFDVYAANRIGWSIYLFCEAVDPNTNCNSQRIPLSLTVLGNPTANNTSLEKCDDNGDGIAMFDLTLANNKVNSGANLTFNYYLTANDAQLDQNPLPTSYSNVLNPQTIYVVVTNTNGCRKVGDVTLNVFASATLRSPDHQ